MVKRLNEKVAREATPPSSGNRIEYESETPGFGLRQNLSQLVCSPSQYFLTPDMSKMAPFVRRASTAILFEFG